MSTGGDSGGDDSLGDGRKGGKRELSQSKRAAQNRAAQVRENRRRVFVSIVALQRPVMMYFWKWELLVKLACWSLVFLLCQFSCHPSHDSSLRNPASL
jgi:hypothetical protein